MRGQDLAQEGVLQDLAHARARGRVREQAPLDEVARVLRGRRVVGEHALQARVVERAPVEQLQAAAHVHEMVVRAIGGEQLRAARELEEQRAHLGWVGQSNNDTRWLTQHE